MERQSKNSRAARRQDEAAIKLMVLGIALAVVPLFLDKSPLGKAIAMLTPAGLLMLAAGALLMWLGRRNGQLELGTQQASMKAASNSRTHNSNGHAPQLKA